MGEYDRVGDVLDHRRGAGFVAYGIPLGRYVLRLTDTLNPWFVCSRACAWGSEVWLIEVERGCDQEQD